MGLFETKHPLEEVLQAPVSTVKKLTEALSIIFIILFVPIRNA
jgi:hypothetical protein